jgi:hypothetical protein
MMIKDACPWRTSMTQVCGSVLCKLESTKGEEGKYVRETSMPSTILSETALSAAFKVSFTASDAFLWAAKEVEKALGAKVAREATLNEERVMKDIVPAVVSVKIW